MKVTLTRVLFSVISLLMAMYVFSAKAVNLNENSSFEADLTGWQVIGGGTTVGMPAAGAYDGTLAAELAAGDFLYQTVPAKAGQTFHASTFMLSESALSDAYSGAKIVKLVFLKSDAFGNPDRSPFAALTPINISKGFLDPTPEWPGVIGTPMFDDSMPLDQWIYSEAQAIAPADTEWVEIYIFNLDFSPDTPQPLWFDNANLALINDPQIAINPSFELGDFTGWNLLAGADNNVAFVGEFDAQDGDYVATLYGPFFSMVTQRFPAVAGHEYAFSGHMLTEEPLPLGPSFGLMKIVFWDENGQDLEPLYISKGSADAPEFPGIIARPLNFTTPENTWLYTEAQGVAPPGTAEVEFFMFNINFNDPAVETPIWFDNMQMSLTAADGDGIANDVDSDPINDSAHFSDSVTSGEIVSYGDQVVSISDESGLAAGVKIITAPNGGLTPARIRVCDSAAILLIPSGSELVLTCGSVIISVESGAGVTMEITVDGQPASLFIPAQNEVTYSPENGDSISVVATLPEAEPALLTIDGDVIEIESGTSLLSIDIDVKPDSDDNCLNLNGKGVIPVAVLGSDTFDVSGIDRQTLRLGGFELRIRGNGKSSCNTEDVNGDGLEDLVCHFNDERNLWLTESGKVVLDGMLYNGSLIRGTDNVCLVP